MSQPDWEVFQDPVVSDALARWKLSLEVNPDHALKFALELQAAHPENRATLTAVAVSYSRLEDIRAAARFCRKVVRDWPEDAWCNEQIELMRKQEPLLRPTRSAAMPASRDSSRYETQCWSCQTALDSNENARCSSCRWLVCDECRSCRRSCAGD
jgi:hypothetical protein